MNNPRHRPVLCCLTCRCWQIIDHSEIGLCCRHAPICPPLHLNTPDGLGRFPKTQALTYCGEWTSASPDIIAERKKLLMVPAVPVVCTSGTEPKQEVDLSSPPAPGTLADKDEFIKNLLRDY